MTSQQKKPPTSEDTPDGNDSEPWQFRLYVAGSAPHSSLAIANLEVLGNTFLNGNYTVEVVDVMKEPLRTLADSVWVTPTLVRLSPEPVCRIIGNLSDQKIVLVALGLAGASHG
jgi:circadian clock protein KaiB